MITICEQCHSPREVVRVSSTFCRVCSDFNKRKNYIRTCEDCGDVKEVKSQGEADCKKCSDCNNEAKREKWVQRDFKPNLNKIVYWYFCPTCPDIRKTRTKRKTPYCKECTKEKSKEIKPVVRFFRVCPTCPPEIATVQVSSKYSAGIKPCISCAAKARSHESRLKKTPKKPRKKAATKYVPIGTDGAKENKVRLSTPKKETKKLTQADEKNMVEEFLKNNKVKMIDSMNNTYENEIKIQGSHNGNY